jgi:type IV pilus assembly protein PilA
MILRGGTKKEMKRLKKKKGFTLMELIIVIAIIGIVSAITVPKFGNIQKDAKLKADIASAKVIADATLSLYAQDKLTTEYNKTQVDTASEMTGANGVLQSIPKLQAKYLDGTSEVTSANLHFYVTTNAGQVNVFAGNATKSIELYPTFPNGSTYPVPLTITQ